MRAQDTALQDMKTGIPWEAITKKHAKGSIYRAWNEFEKFAADRVKTLKNEFTELENQIASHELGASSLEKIKNDLVARVENLEAHHKELENRIAEATETLQETTLILEAKEKKVSLLQEKGFTDELIERVAQIQAKSEEDLISRIDTLDSFVNTSRDLQHLQQVQNQLTESVAELENTEKDIEEEARSERNKITRLRQEHHLILDAIDVVKAALQRYPKTELLQLHQAIENIEIRGQYKTTLTYLIERLEQVKDEVTLEKSITSKKAEYETIQTEIEGALGTLRALQNTIPKTLEKAEVQFATRIKTLTSTSIAELQKTQQNGANAIEALTNFATERITKSGGRAEQSVEQIQSKLWNSTYSLVTFLDIKMNEYQEEVQKWGSIREEAGRLDYYLKHAILLFGPLVNQDAILAVEPDVIRQITHRIHLYIQKKLPNAKCRAPRHIAQRESSISDIWEIQLISLSEFLATELDRILEARP